MGAAMVAHVSEPVSINHGSERAGHSPLNLRKTTIP
jgi:hypothetical protein